MINITYTICCDQCGQKIDRTLNIPYVAVIDQDNSAEFMKFFSPVLPKTWILKKPTKAGEPDKMFCGRECMNENNQ